MGSRKRVLETDRNWSDRIEPRFAWEKEESAKASSVNRGELLMSSQKSSLVGTEFPSCPLRSDIMAAVNGP